MKDMCETKDRRLVLLDALLRYANKSRDQKPHFYQDETLTKLGVCENVFLDLQMLIGDKCCYMDDCHDGRIMYAVNATRCSEIRRQIIKSNKEKVRNRELTRITVATALYGTLFALILGRFMV